MHFCKISIQSLKTLELHILFNFNKSINVNLHTGQVNFNLEVGNIEKYVVKMKPVV